MRDVMRHVLSRYQATDDNTRRHVLFVFRSQSRLANLNCSTTRTAATAAAAISSRSNDGAFVVRRKGWLSSTVASASARDNTWCVRRWFHLSTSSSAQAPDHYEILGVTTTASQKDIKDAFYHLSKELHPDRNPNSPEAVERFKQVSAAYEVVGNVINRKQYDATLRPAERGGRADGDSFDDRGPGFSSMSGKQWRQRRTSFNGYRKTVQDEMFDRWMSDHDAFNRRFQKGFRRPSSNAQESQHMDSKEWYEQHYKQHDNREHPFEEQEQRHHQQQKQQQQQQHGDHQQQRQEEQQQDQHRRRDAWEAEQRRPGRQPWEEELRRHQQQQHQHEADYSQSGEWRSRERYGGEFKENPKVVRIQTRFIIRFALLWTVIGIVGAFLQEREKERGLPGPTFLNDESKQDQKAISQDEFIRRYYEKLAADETEERIRRYYQKLEEKKKKLEAEQAEAEQAEAGRAAADRRGG